MLIFPQSHNKLFDIFSFCHAIFLLVLFTKLSKSCSLSLFLLSHTYTHCLFIMLGWHTFLLLCINMVFFRVKYYSCWPIAARLIRDCLLHSLACQILLMFEVFVRSTQSKLAVQTSLIAQLYTVNRWEWSQTKRLSKYNSSVSLAISKKSLQTFWITVNVLYNVKA